MKLFYLFLPILFLVGCTQSHTSKNVLRINFQDGDLPSTHPHIGIDYRMRSLQSAIFEGLTRLDKEGNPELAAAESVDISSCQKFYTFTLRPAKWSNGKPVTAFHFANAWKQAITKESGCRRPDLFYVIKNAEEIKKGEIPLEKVGIEALDEKTLRIELKHPAPYFLELASNPIFSPLFDLSEEPSIFNGPFIIDQWKRDQIIVLKKNPLYWDEGTVKLKRLEILFVTDPLTAVNLFEKGELDWIGSPFSCLPAEIIPHYQKSGILQTKDVARIYWLYCNCTVPPFSNPLIRKALSLALDREAMVQHVLFGHTATSAPLPVSLSFIANQTLLKAQNRALAKQVFAQGMKELGFTHDTFPPITLSHSHISGQKQLAEIVQSYWKEVLGLKVHIEGSEWNVFFSDLSQGKFQIGGCLKSALYKDPTYHLELLEDKNHSYNISRWEDPTYKQLLSKARDEIDIGKRNTYLQKAEAILLDQMPIIPIYSEAYLYRIRPHIQDVVIHDLGHVDFKWVKMNSTHDKK